MSKQIIPILCLRTKHKKAHKKGIASQKLGFSLMEIVVVIAIMAILAALLVPVLLRYTENSRAQKDVSTMDEVVNAVQLAMADSNCYDEMIRYSCDNNFITYTDSSGKYGQQIIDAEYWAPDGYGKATTITFNPEKNSQGDTIYRLENAIVNDMTYGNGSIAQTRQMEGIEIENNQCLLPNAKLSEGLDSGYLYNKVKSTIGSSIITTSATYSNSSFTIFIRFTQKDGVTVADVNGSFNGTNLSTDASAAVGSGTNTQIENPETGEKEQGPATESGGVKNNNYTSSALQGSGAIGNGGTSRPIENYKQPSYIDNLQKENEFEYYSTLKAAVDDVNANTIGKNADCNKDNAVAGIYTKDGKVEVVLLKDHETQEPVLVKMPMTINLGGKKLTGKNMTCLQSEGTTLIVDGRLQNSTIHAESNGDNNAIAIYSKYSIKAYGGNYYAYSENGGAAAICTTSTASGMEAYDCKVISESSNGLSAYGIQCDGRKSTIERCDVLVVNNRPCDGQGSLAIGLYIAHGGDMVNVTDCKIEAYTHSQRINGKLYTAVGITALASNATIKNTKVISASIGLHSQLTGDQKNYTINLIDSDITGYTNAIGFADNYHQTGLLTLIANNNKLRSVKNSEWQNSSTINSPDALSLAGDNIIGYVNGCTISTYHTSAVQVDQTAKLYISMSTINPVSLDIGTLATIYIGARNNFTGQGITSGTVIETNNIYTNP